MCCHDDIVYTTDEDNNFVSATNLGTMPLLWDAYLSHVGYGEFFVGDVNAYSNFISCMAHARTLTMCSIG
jgi:hypothetical protein